MKKNILYLIGILLLSINLSVKAQTDSASEKIFRIGIFAPIYFDSVFNGMQYKYDKQMPRLVIPGLEFTEGAQIALDTITTNNHSVKAFIYDIKSKDQNISALIQTHAFDSLDLMIGSASGNDFKQLADIALKNNIPFISATYPNDGGITGNPFTVILNSTLNTHCWAIYNYIVKSVPTSKLVLFRKKGSTEDRIAAQFTKLNLGNNDKPLLNFPVINLPDSFTVANIQNQLDSNRINTIVAGSMDENFGRKLASICAGLSKKYSVNLIGMPTWDGVKDFSKPEFKNF
ncbi:MAG: ABC transporter substrate-binding protein, partial [Sphingobacteriales bacterium]